MKVYQGGCHRGAVRFEAEADVAKVMECNCSHCEKKGFLLAFTPVEKFRLTSGEDMLTEYRFKKKEIAHLFCSVCGVQAFGQGMAPDGSKMAAINVRCIDGIDITAVERQPVDGKSF